MLVFPTLRVFKASQVWPRCEDCISRLGPCLARCLSGEYGWCGPCQSPELSCPSTVTLAPIHWKRVLLLALRPDPSAHLGFLCPLLVLHPVLLDACHGLKMPPGVAAGPCPGMKPGAQAPNPRALEGKPKGHIRFLEITSCLENCSSLSLSASGCSLTV